MIIAGKREAAIQWQTMYWHSIRGQPARAQFYSTTNKTSLSIRQHELSQHYPREGWVEEDPMEIWSTQYAAMLEARCGRRFSR